MSRLIKSASSYIDKQQSKVISIRQFGHPSVQEEEKEEQVEIPVVQQVDVEAIIQSAEQEANEIINNANNYKNSILQEIEQLKQAWEEERLQLTELARQEGFQAGLEEGRTEGFLEYKNLIDNAKQVIESSKEDYFKKIESAEQTILSLGLKTAEKILGMELKENPAVFQGVVKNAIIEAKESREVQLHVHPMHYGYLLSQKDELLKNFPRDVEFYIYPNEELDEYGCFIESDNGRIDASIDVQLEELKKKLFELLESE